MSLFILLNIYFNEHYTIFQCSSTRCSKSMDWHDIFLVPIKIIKLLIIVINYYIDTSILYIIL